jgi:hypothetical protein
MPGPTDERRLGEEGLSPLIRVEGRKIFRLAQRGTLEDVEDDLGREGRRGWDRASERGWLRGVSIVAALASGRRERRESWMYIPDLLVPSLSSSRQVRAKPAGTTTLPKWGKRQVSSSFVFDSNQHQTQLTLYV